jgi:hypothetical protein
MEQDGVREEEIKRMREERRQQQEEAWKNTSIDVRQQYHEREQAAIYQSCIKTAINWWFIRFVPFLKIVYLLLCCLCFVFASTLSFINYRLIVKLDIF